METPEDSRKWIRETIQSYIDTSPENRLKDGEPEKAWDEVLVGFAGGDDPIFTEYKTHVGPFHWTPKEVFDLTYPDRPADASELSVVVWVLPQREATRKDNRRETVYPAERWARNRIFGEKCNAALRAHMVEVFQEAGWAAVSPMLSPNWSRQMSERYGYASTWSERHAAFAAGLGTFGLCDGLITPKGKAMRVGSVVVRAHIPKTPRPYTDHREYCLFFSSGACGLCIDRCPVGALSESGHDKIKCRTHLRTDVTDYVKNTYGFDGYGCGLCQTKVPCEFRIPRTEDASMRPVDS